MKRTCFVIQGFGKKTDFESGRTLDLDASYEVIKEAVIEAGLSCVRADEIPQSGHIERVMYEQLLQADLVIADLSTSNVNAFYELGVRFGLRPWATIVLAESRITFPFDINHIPITTYEHMGSDIGRREAARFKDELVKLIGEIMGRDRTDSPVFTFLPRLASHDLSEIEPVDALPEDHGPTLSDLKRQARDAIGRSDFEKAVDLWQKVRDEGPKDDHVVQQLALATYKSKMPSEIEALKRAKKTLEYLQPRESLDPETLGLWAGVHKRLHEIQGSSEALDEAITATERGFVLQRDSYNGINLAYLLDVRSAQSPPDLAQENHCRARAVRRRVSDICQARLEVGEGSNNDELYWLFATLQESAVGLGDDETAAKWSRKASEVAGAPWMTETTNGQLTKLRGLLEKIEERED